MPDDPRSEDRDRIWSQLMGSAQAGDRGAYERLLRQVTPVVRAIVRRHCRHPDDTEEIVQETLLTLHRVRHTYDPHRSFLAWLAAITTRRSIDALRRRRRIERHEVAGIEIQETFADTAANNGLEGVRAAEELGAILRRLPPRQREALEALRLRELSAAEAAIASGQSAGAIKVNAHRALKTLRALLESHGKRA